MNSQTVVPHAERLTPTTPQPFQPLMPIPPPPPLAGVDRLVMAGLFAATLLLYMRTLAPTITSASSDNPELIVKAAQGAVAQPPGSPVYVWLGHLFTWWPFGEMATRVNFLSALCGALTVALLYGLARRHLAAARLGAGAGAVALGLSAVFWSQAVIAELYVPNLLVLSLAVWGLLEWAARRPGGATSAARVWLVGAGVAFGLSLGIHLSNLLYGPAIGLFLLAGVPKRAIVPLRYESLRQWGRHSDWRSGMLAASALLLTTSLPYLWLFFAMPTTSEPALPVVIGPAWTRFYEFTLNAWSVWRFYYGLPQLPDRLAIFVTLLVNNFSLIGVGMLAGGLLRLRRFPRVALLLLSAGVANLVFYLTYRAPDTQVFFIPVFWIGACLIVLAVDGLDQAARAMIVSRGRTVPPSARASLPGRLARIIVLLITAVGLFWNMPQSYAYNDRSSDVHLRDFYGNLFRELPPEAQYYQRGGLAFGLFYYIDLYGVRRDVQVHAAARWGEPANPPWPEDPVFSGSTSHDIDLPAFLADVPGNSKKWFEPYLFGMFRWHTQVLTETGWLKTFQVLPAPPTNWLLPTTAAAAQPTHPTNLHLNDDLTLLGFDADPTAQRGRPWRLVRYWRTTTPDLPHIATVFGDHVAVEYHPPLNGQLRDYLGARGIGVGALPAYILREEIRLVLPSYVPPGRYPIMIATIRNQLASQLYQPTDPAALLPNEQFLTTVDLLDGPPVDPLNLLSAR